MEGTAFSRLFVSGWLFFCARRKAVAEQTWLGAGLLAGAFASFVQSRDQTLGAPGSADAEMGSDSAS